MKTFRGVHYTAKEYSQLLSRLRRLQRTIDPMADFDHVSDEYFLSIVRRMRKMYIKAGMVGMEQAAPMLQLDESSD